MSIRDGLESTSGEIRSFLMIGQSNMAGRGDFGDVEPIKNADCFMLRMGRWQKMTEPINPDREILNPKWHSGISLAASFADELAKATGGRVGLIPCADGGTRIAQWMPGEILYDHALLMARLAMRTSRLSGILWHQGESDCGSEEAVLRHKAKFCEMITALRRDLGDPTLPLVIGELSDKSDREKWKMGDRPVLMNRQYREIAEALPACGVASAEGLTLKSDGIHFDSVSLREFGKRYFQVYQTLVSDGKEQE